MLDALVDAGIELPGSRELHYDNDDYDRVVAFYDDWTSQDGEWRRLETDGSVSYDRLDVDYLQSISVLADFDPGGQGDGPVTCVLLAFG